MSSPASPASRRRGRHGRSCARESRPPRGAPVETRDASAAAAALPAAPGQGRGGAGRARARGPPPRGPGRARAHTLHRRAGPGRPQGRRLPAGHDRAWKARRASAHRPGGRGWEARPHCRASVRRQGGGKERGARPGHTRARTHTVLGAHTHTDTHGAGGPGLWAWGRSDDSEPVPCLPASLGANYCEDETGWLER